MLFNWCASFQSDMRWFLHLVSWVIFDVGRKCAVNKKYQAWKLVGQEFRIFGGFLLLSMHQAIFAISDTQKHTIDLIRIWQKLIVCKSVCWCVATP